MITRCDVTEAAARLSLQLEATSIPDGFGATGKYRQNVSEVQQLYTNYERLLGSVPACPDECPLHPGNAAGARCFSRDFAIEMLEADARQLAAWVYEKWRVRQGRAPQSRCA